MGYRIERDAVGELYFVWDRGTWARLSDRFTTREFECQCANASCQVQRLNVKIIHKLQIIREALGAPIKVTSGYRCKAHQKALESTPGIETVSVSQHVLGNAADISVDKSLFTKLLMLAESNFLAVGIGKSFLHVDLRGPKVRRWSYSY